MRKKTNSENPFKWKHFKGEIILWVVRLYCRYVISYANLKEMALERRLTVERSTMCRWVHEYGPELTNERI